MPNYHANSFGSGVVVIAPTVDGTAGNPLITDADGTSRFADVILDTTAQQKIDVQVDTDDDSGVVVRNTSGNVVARLHVDSGTEHGILIIESSASGNRAILDGADGGGFLQLNSAAGTDLKISAAADSHMHATDNFRLGIGASTTPDAQVQIWNRQAGDHAIHLMAHASQSVPILAISTSADSDVFTVDVNGKVVADAVILQDSETTYTPTGTTQSIDLNDHNHFTLDVGSATGTLTVTFTRPTSSTAGRGIVIQDASPKDITWAAAAGSIIWMGTEPVWSGDTSKKRILFWTSDGTDIYLAATETN